MNEWEQVYQTFFVKMDGDGEENKDLDTDAICRIRTEYCMEWYTKKARKNKLLFYFFTTIGLVCPLLNAVLAVCIECRAATVILSGITTLATAVLGMTNAHSKWDNYRSAAEFLKAEYTLFKGKVEPYDKKGRGAVYIKTIEEFMRETHMRWKKNFQTEKSDDKDEKI